MVLKKGDNRDAIIVLIHVNFEHFIPFVAACSNSCWETQKRKLTTWWFIRQWNWKFSVRCGFIFTEFRYNLLILRAGKPFCGQFNKWPLIYFDVGRTWVIFYRIYVHWQLHLIHHPPEKPIKIDTFENAQFSSFFTPLILIKSTVPTLIHHFTQSSSYTNDYNDNLYGWQCVICV